MAATIMHSISSLVAKLSHDHPSITFAPGPSFAWSPSEQAVFYLDNTPDSAALLLHELSHALLEHTDYSRDIELLQIERQAWQYAVTHLATRYDISIDEALVEDTLDTYREWLHRRSLCPTCDRNGIQESPSGYRCVHCHARWTVNQAHFCQLRRTRLARKNTPS